MKKHIGAWVSSAALLLSLLTTTAIGVGASGGKSSDGYEASKGTPIIDGTIDEAWAATPQYDLSVVLNAAGTAASQETNRVAGTYFKMLWDEGHIYYLVHVKDSTSIQGTIGSPVWNPQVMDFINLFMQLPGQSGNARTWAVFGPAEAKMGNNPYMAAPGTLPDHSDYTVVKTADGYNLEWAIAKTVLGAETPDFKVDDVVKANVFYRDSISGTIKSGSNAGTMQADYMVSWSEQTEAADGSGMNNATWSFQDIALVAKASLPSEPSSSEPSSSEPASSEPESSAPASSEPASSEPSTGGERPETPLDPNLPQFGYGTPTIDAKLDDVWKAAPEHLLEAISTSDGLGQSNEAEGTYYKLLWDEDNLYFLVYVFDYSNFPGDGIDIFFREQNLPEWLPDVIPGSEEGKIPNPGKTCLITSMNIKRDSTQVDLWQNGKSLGTLPCSVRVREDGWVAELALPRDRGANTVMTTPFQKGDQIQVNVCYSDDNTGEPYLNPGITRAYFISWAKMYPDEGGYKWWSAPRSLPVVQLNKEGNAVDPGTPSDPSSTPSTPGESSSTPESSSDPDKGESETDNVATGEPLYALWLVAGLAIISAMALVVTKRNSVKN